MHLKSVHTFSFDPIILLQEIFPKEIQIPCIKIIIVKRVRNNLNNNRRIAMDVP